MKITTEELFQLLGNKDAEIFLLRKRITQLESMLNEKAEEAV